MMLEVAVQADEEWDSSSDWDRIARDAAGAAIAESLFAHFATFQRSVEISVRLTSDREVQALNQTWRGKDKPTNVLSFPLAEPDELATAPADGPELLLGDIVLARGVCAAEAAGKSISLEAHASHLLVHGTLHLLGHDHHDDGSAADMEGREVRALRRLGIGDPYEGAA